MVKNTTGTNPGAGIDIEHNSTADPLHKITIKSSIFYNNNHHIQVNQRSTSADRSVSIAGNIFRNHRGFSGLNQSTLRQTVDAKLRVLKHLPEQGDLSLIILKGHLLVEELLFTLVQSAVKHPEAINSANLTFYNLACVAKALFYESRLGHIWDAIFELNRLRNTLAHDLEPRDLDSKLRRFGHAGSRGHPEAGNLVVAEPERVMVESIQVICGALIGMISSRLSNGDA
jgi:hypothetical protein